MLLDIERHGFAAGKWGLVRPGSYDGIVPNLNKQKRTNGQSLKKGKLKGAGVAHGARIREVIGEPKTD
jgi:hypothetical protein